MGAAQQKEAAVYFSSVATVAEHPTDEEFSTQLLHYRTGLCGGAELFFVAQPIVSQLVEASGSNGRVRWLVNYCLRTLTSAAGSTTPERLDLLCAALHVLDVTCRTMFCGSGGDIRRVLSLLGLEAKAKPPSTEGASDGVALCHQLMSFTSLVPLTAETVSAHHAVTRTLLALLSTPIYHKPIVDEHELDGGILAVLGAPDYLVQPFVTTLTTRLAEWGSTTRSFSSPSLTYESSKPQSARRFFGWWGSGKSDITASTANSESGKLLARAGMSFVTSTTCDEQVYRHSAQLLALLISYHKGRLPNVVHYQFLVKPIGPPIGFAVLLRSIATKLTTCPAIAVVLYCLLNDSPNCLKAVMEEDADSLMGVMVELYHLIHLVCTTGGSSTSQPGSTSAVAVPCGISSDNLPELLPVLTTELLRFSYPFIHFMAGTLFLLLSQDRVINQYCCSATCPIPPYYHNRYASGGTVTISSLALIAHCMGISVGVTERNEALGALFIPSLANFSLFAHDLDIYGAQRLIHLVCMIVRKIRRTLLATGAKFDQAVDGCDELPSEAGDSAFVTSGSASSIAADIVGDMDLLVLQLRTVVEAVEGFLHGVNRHNEALIYEILYARETLLLFHQSLVVQSPIGDSITSRVTDCLTNMHDLIHHYEAEVASHTSGTSSPSEILGIIRKTCRGGSNDVAADLSAPSKGDPLLSEGGQGKVGDLLYTYEESPQSYSFFAPFLWATMLSDAQRPGGMLWARDCDSLPLFQS